MPGPTPPERRDGPADRAADRGAAPTGRAAEAANRAAGAANRDAGPLEPLAEGLWRWTAVHPDWHPATEFGASVASYVARVGDDTLLIDPLWPAAASAPLLTALDPLVAAGRRLIIAVTLPYHVRDTRSAWERWGPEHETQILGHAGCMKRLPADAPFRAIDPGDALPHGLRTFAVGSPPRHERPLLVPEHDALAFGDVVVGHGGGLAIWIQQELTAKRRRWFADRYAPTLAPLAELGARRVLTTHGPPVLDDGAAALQAAIDRGPWYHRPH